MESKVMDSSLQHAVEVSNHRKMLAAPALKILADPDNSEKSFKVLVSVMERCHREPANQGVFLGAGSSDSERKLGFGKGSTAITAVFCVSYSYQLI